MAEHSLGMERREKIRIRRKTCTLRLVPNYATYSDNVAYAAAGEIVVDSGLCGQALLDALLHEFAHVSFPDLNEDAVNVSASSWAKALCKLFPVLKEIAL